MNHYTFKLGNINCTALKENAISLPIYKEFHPSLKEKVLAAHLEHGATDETVSIGFNYLHLATGDLSILIDTGSGGDALTNSMQEAGIDPSKVDYLIITHADSDHIGGLDSFPKAKIIMPKRSHRLWNDEESRNQLNVEFFDALSRIFPTERIQQSVKNRNKYALETLKSLENRLILVEDDAEFLLGMSMFYTPGHRSDHYAIEVRSNGEHLIIVADALRHGFQLKYPNMSSQYDSITVQWTAAIQEIRRRDPEQKAIYFGTHIAFPGLLKYNEKGLAVLF